MRKNKGFTLIELMVVILIVAILAAVLAPMMTGRINEAKWTEGKAAAGTLATAIRATLAEQRDALAPVDLGTGITGVAGSNNFEVIGVLDNDLLGKYFNVACYAISNVTYAEPTGAMTYDVTVTPVAGTGIRGSYMLDETGTWTYTAPAE